MTPFSPKTPSEQVFLAFNYVRELGEGETIASGTWTASVLEGVDANPGALISGGVFIEGPKVSQLVIGGVIDTRYCLQCEALTSRGQRLVLSNSIWIRAACANV
jgi:hypothetical protein